MEGQYLPLTYVAAYLSYNGKYNYDLIATFSLTATVTEFQQETSAIAGISRPLIARNLVTTCMCKSRMELTRRHIKLTAQINHKDA